MKRLLSAATVAVMFIAILISVFPSSPALNAESNVIPSATSQRRTKLDLTGYSSPVSSAAEGWAYDPTGNNGSPLLTLNSYGLPSAHSAPILAPANTSIEVNGVCYIDNSLMNSDCDVISGSCDGYLRISGNGTLNLYAEQFVGRSICVPIGGVNDASEVLYMTGVTVNCYSMERDMYSASQLVPCIYGYNGMELRDCTINTFEGGTGLYMNGYLPIGGVTEETAKTLLISNCDINIQSVTGDQWAHAKGIVAQFGHILITDNSNIVINAGSSSIWSYFNTAIESGSVYVMSTPVSAADTAALVYCKRLLLGAGLQRLYIGITRYTLAKPFFCTAANESSLANGLTVTIGSFANGTFAYGNDPSNNNLNAFEVVGSGGELVYYSVVFMNWNFVILSSQTVLENTAAVAPAPPVRAGYVFGGWDADFSCVTGNMIINAVFYPRGDSNCDGKLTFSDISRVYVYLSNMGTLSEQGLLNADMNSSGNITFLDVSLIYAAILNS